MENKEEEFHPALALIPFFGMTAYPKSWLNSSHPGKALITMGFFFYQLVCAGIALAFCFQ